uniref:Serpin domain-containing protein n=1 Tax=Plectus sambesii TaxID=2011161 RepID=A0A914XQG9_9BILA
MALDLAHAQFSIDLLRNLSSFDQECIVSPLAVGIALTALYSGAGGETKQQMLETIFAGLPEDDIFEIFERLVIKMSCLDKQYVVPLATRIYVQEERKVFSQVVEKISKLLMVDAVSADFRTRADSVAEQIGEWISQVTKGGVKLTRTRNSFSVDTSMLVVSAMCLKADWKYSFVPMDTRRMKFHRADESTSEVSMMNQCGIFPYMETNDVKVLGMPFVGNDYELTMYIFLPRHRHGLDDFEKSITGIRLLSLICTTEELAVDVNVPKMAISKSFDLSKAVSQLGMPSVFDRQSANFERMAGADASDCRLHVSQLLHKAVFNMNEAGTDESAKHDELSLLYRLRTEKSFVADHPFLFAIVMTNYLLFLGRFTG